MGGGSHHGTCASYSHHNQIGVARISAPQYSLSRVAELNHEPLPAPGRRLPRNELLQLVSEKRLQPIAHLGVVRGSASNVEQRDAGLKSLRKRECIRECAYGIHGKVSRMENIAQDLGSAEAGIRLDGEYRHGRKTQDLFRHGTHDQFSQSSPPASARHNQIALMLWDQRSEDLP